MENQNFAYREPMSNLDIVPFRDAVLVKSTFKVSTLELSNAKLSPTSKRVLTIEGYGEATYGFKLNDVVFLNNEFKDSLPYRIDIYDNPYSVDRLVKAFEALTIDERKKLTHSSKSVVAQEYFIIPAYGITGYAKYDSDMGKYHKDLSSVYHLHHLTKQVFKVAN